MRGTTGPHGTRAAREAGLKNPLSGAGVWGRSPHQEEQARVLRLALLTAFVTLCLFAMFEPQQVFATQAGPAILNGIGLFAAGLAVGGYGTVVGIGGGPLLVPILHFMY